MRQSFEARAVAVITGGSIAFVFPPPQTVFPQPLADFRAPKTEQRTNNTFRGGRPNTCQTLGTGTSQKTKENSLGLVIQGMTGRDGVEAKRRSAPGKPGVARLPRFLLQIARPGV